MNIQKRIKLIFSFISIALISCTISNPNNTDPKVTTSPISPSPVTSASSLVISSSTPSPMSSDNVDPEIKKLNLKGKIVYVKADKDLNFVDNTEIHLMNADGTNDKILTTGSYDTDPKLSRDGSKIVFTRKMEKDNIYYYKIFTVNHDGSNIHNVTNSDFNERNPCFSDDGYKIAYNDWKRIYTINSDGTDEKLIITHEAFESYYKSLIDIIVPISTMPNWYRNKIVFITSEYSGAGGKISIANSDGSSMNSIDDIKILNNNINFNPVWSTDGSKIAFSSYGVILSINSDGSNEKVLANGINGNSKYPSWSPDGTKVSFERNGEIYVMNSDGTNQTKIIKGHTPYWSM